MVVPTARVLAVVLGLLLIQCSLTIDEEELGGKHLLDCAEGEKACNVQGVVTCVGLDDPRYGCADASCLPCNLPNATAVCGPTGKCVKASCHPSYEDCNEIAADGCEATLNTSLAHCGACDAKCRELPHAEVSCGSGRCYIRRCLDGYLDCNREAMDGCEVDAHHLEDCGECGKPCGDVCCHPERCCKGVCKEFTCGE